MTFSMGWRSSSCVFGTRFSRRGTVGTAFGAAASAVPVAVFFWRLCCLLSRRVVKVFWMRGRPDGMHSVCELVQ